MEILVSGSLAYDRIMKFGGRFRDHILADQLDNINISFGVDSLTEHIGWHRRQHSLFPVSPR